MKRWYMYGGQVRRWFRWRNEYWIVSDYGDRIGPFRDFDKARKTLIGFYNNDYMVEAGMS